MTVKTSKYCFLILWTEITRYRKATHRVAWRHDNWCGTSLQQLRCQMEPDNYRIIWRQRALSPKFTMMMKMMMMIVPYSTRVEAGANSELYSISLHLTWINHKCGGITFRLVRGYRGCALLSMANRFEKHDRLWTTITCAQLTFKDNSLQRSAAIDELWTACELLKYSDNLFLSIFISHIFANKLVSSTTAILVIAIYKGNGDKHFGHHFNAATGRIYRMYRRVHLEIIYFLKGRAGARPLNTPWCCHYCVHFAMNCYVAVGYRSNNKTIGHIWTSYRHRWFRLISMIVTVFTYQ